MILESLLAFFHFSAILAMVVFLTSEGALCRAEWLNAEALKRLVHVDRLYLISIAAVLLTGLARAYWGAKGADWYWAQPMMHIKLTVFAIAALMALPVTASIRRWYWRWQRAGDLPLIAEIRRTRILIMIAAHIIMIVPLFAVFLARGVFGVAS